ncbi:MAG: hypothetical protein HRU20_25090 [Pseudomonadales bacterium]|nr:hypothetical protein [Pseudomonadales bacterium]
MYRIFLISLSLSLLSACGSDSKEKIKDEVDDRTPETNTAGVKAPVSTDAPPLQIEVQDVILKSSIVNTPSLSLSSETVAKVDFYGDCEGLSFRLQEGDNYFYLNGLPEGDYNNCVYQLSDAKGQIYEAVTLPPFTLEYIKKITESTHSSSDDKLTSQTITSYNNYGDILTKTADNNGDGIINTNETNTYDDAGNKLTSTYTSDADGDGFNNTIRIYKYDEFGHTLSYQRDNESDGIWEANQSWQYDVSADGKPLITYTDNNNDGIVDTISSVTYNFYGSILSSTTSTAEGVLQTKQLFSYDEKNNRFS